MVTCNIVTWCEIARYRLTMCSADMVVKSTAESSAVIAGARGADGSESCGVDVACRTS